MLDGDGDGRFALEGQVAREHLVHDDAERVNVAARVDMTALGLLRRDVVDGTQRFLRQGVLRRLETRDAEVGDLDAAVF